MDSPPPPGPEIGWKDEYGYNHDILPHLYVNGDGIAFIGAKKWLSETPGHTMGPTDEYVKIVRPDGSEVGEFSLGFTDDTGEVLGLEGAPGGGAYVFGEHDNNDARYGDTMYQVLFVQRIAADGTLLWEEPTFVGIPIHNTVVYDGTVDEEGNLYVMGTSLGRFDGTTYPDYDAALWIAKIAPDGTVVAKKDHRAFDYISPHNIAYSPDGYLGILQTAEGSAGDYYYYPVMTVVDPNSLDILEPEVQILTENNTDYYQDIAFAPNGDLLVVGKWAEWEGNIQNWYQALIMRYDIANGTGEVIRVMDGGARDDEAMKVLVTPDNEVLVAGWTNGYVNDSGPWENQKGSGGAWLAKYGSTLDRQWVHMAGGANEFWAANGIGYHPTHGYYIAGHNRANTDGDTSTSEGSGQFIVRFDP